jgi:acetyl esterase
MRELHPDCRAFLDEVARLNIPASTVPEIRARYRRLCRHFGGPRVEGVETTEVDAPVRARLYATAPAAPLLVWFHGGRMISGDLETHDAVCRLLAFHTGWRVLAVDYRLAPEDPYPAAVEDASAAFAFARSLSPAVTLGGDSAGASLALTVALASPQASAALVLIYPMIDATCHLPSHAEFRGGPGTSSDDIRLGYTLWLPPGADAQDPSISPLFSPSFAGLPPTFLLTAGVDPLRDEGVRLAARLIEDEVPVTHVHYADHLHGFLTYPARFSAAGEAAAQIALFLSLREQETSLHSLPVARSMI